MITAYADGAVTLLHNGNSKIATTNTGVAITGENIVSDWTRTAGLRVATSGTDPGDGNAVIGNNLTHGLLYDMKKKILSKKKSLE